MSAEQTPADLEGYNKSKQSKGGKERGKKLSSERKAEIAREAAAGRWGRHATHEGPLQIGDMILDTAVLDDGMRVISQGKLMKALGLYYSGWLSTNREKPEEGAAELPYYLAHKSLKEHVQRHLGDVQIAPIKYRTRSGQTANGIDAKLLPKICEVWLDARHAGGMGAKMEDIAKQAEILIRGFAQIGIVALIDEATGYQYERQRDDLQELLKAILSDELRKYARAFPPYYFREMCRLRGTPYRADMRLPSYFGHLTNDVVYKRLAPGLLQKLQERNPVDLETGRRKAKHTQHLSEDVGDPMLQQHLGLVVGLMRISKTWEQFKAHLDVAAPIRQELPLFKGLEAKDN